MMVQKKKLDVGLDLPTEKAKVKLATEEQVTGLSEQVTALKDSLVDMGKKLGELKTEIQLKRKAGNF